MRGTIDPLATMTEAEWRTVTARLDAEGLGYRADRSWQEEERANRRALAILAGLRR